MELAMKVKQHLLDQSPSFHKRINPSIKIKQLQLTCQRIVRSGSSIPSTIRYVYFAMTKKGIHHVLAEVVFACLGCLIINRIQFITGLSL